MRRLALPGGGCDCIELPATRRCSCAYCVAEVKRVQGVVRELTYAPLANPEE
jgi:hypothetical protein